MQWDVGQNGQAGQAKHHAQIAHAEVTLSGLLVIRNNNSLSIPGDLWQTNTAALLSHKSETLTVGFSLGNTKDLWNSVSQAYSVSLRKRYLFD